MPTTKLIFGCGYLGARVARRWLAAGDRVLAVTRSAERAADLRQQGIAPIVADVTDANTLVALAELPPLDTVLYAIGFDRRLENSRQQVYVEGLRNVLGRLPADATRLVYISTTGVYGQHDGAWVNEESPCEPSREGGQVALAAEQLLLAHSLGERSIRLRLAGLYGPGRVPRRAELAAGQPVAAPRHGYLNLIHVDDAVAVILAAEALAVPPPRLYLVSDGQPVLRAEYFAEVARLTGGPPPRFIEPPADSPAAERNDGDKRIDSSRLRSELKIELKYPSYRAGLAAIIAAESQRASGATGSASAQ
ncbi:MAG: NAD-dependent epimerase/dehydratase family protein [Pirellulales bacterium]|nr:NAD-dependent epimerase/dehydratase family protein [Pirellulales bacterium]